MKPSIRKDTDVSTKRKGKADNWNIVWELYILRSTCNHISSCGLDTVSRTNSYIMPPPSHTHTHLASSRNSTKDLQNKDQISSLGFPTPPPAVADAGVFTEQAPDEYLSLQVHRCDSYSSSCLKKTLSLHSYSVVFPFNQSVCTGA